jgi:hypothetical protein
VQSAQPDQNRRSAVASVTGHEWCLTDEFEDDEPVSSWRCTQCGVIYCGVFPPSKTLTVTVDMVCTGKRPTLADVFNKAFPEGATCDALRKDKRFK